MGSDAGRTTCILWKKSYKNVIVKILRVVIKCVWGECTTSSGTSTSSTSSTSKLIRGYDGEKNVKMCGDDKNKFI